MNVPSLLTSHGVGNGGGDTFYTLPSSPSPLADYRLRWEINLLEGLFPSRSFRVVTPTNSGPDNERKSSATFPSPSFSAFLRRKSLG